MLYDITEVCRRFGTTSRTLRFYESKGIITSTKIGLSARRHYTDEQVEQIRCVMVLRTLGLSIKAIGELQKGKNGLKEAVLFRRAEISAFIESKSREINLLNEALSVIESGEDIYGMSHEKSVCESELREITENCTSAIVSGDSDELYRYVGSRLKDYLSPNVFTAARRDTLELLGDFIEFDRIEVDRDYPNVIYSFVKYDRLGLKIKFVFHSRKIEGLWLGYYEVDKK